MGIFYLMLLHSSLVQWVLLAPPTLAIMSLCLKQFMVLPQTSPENTLQILLDYSMQLFKCSFILINLNLPLELKMHGSKHSKREFTQLIFIHNPTAKKKQLLRALPKLSLNDSVKSQNISSQFIIKKEIIHALNVTGCDLMLAYKKH